MPKRKEPELTPDKQFDRFVKLARELGVDESGKEFEMAFNKVASPKNPKKRARGQKA
jgi:hypothetical protein